MLIPGFSIPAKLFSPQHFVPLTFVFQIIGTCFFETWSEVGSRYEFVKIKQYLWRTKISSPKNKCYWFKKGKGGVIDNSSNDMMWVLSRIVNKFANVIFMKAMVEQGTNYFTSFPAVFHDRARGEGPGARGTWADRKNYPITQLSRREKMLI